MTFGGIHFFGLCLGITFASMVLPTRLLAQPDSASATPAPAKQKTIFSAGLGAQYGFIFAHSEAVQNTRGARPYGVEMMLSWQRNDASSFNLCNCYPRKGLLINYYDFDSRILGRGASAAYFLEPTYRLSNHSAFSFRAAAGLSYLSNPYDSARNPSNQSYSTHLSAYLLVGLGYWAKLNKHWWLNASVNYQHISNGGFRQPNKGINWPTAGLALSYQWEDRPFYRGLRRSDKPWKTQTLRWDATAFGLPRRSTTENSGRQRSLLAGLGLQASKQVGRTNALTLGLEAYRDEELKQRLRQDSISASPFKAGLLVGHEFLLGKFIFSSRLGLYLFDQTPYYNNLYHRWGISYSFNEKLGLGINLQAHKQVADYIDFRLIYTFKPFRSKAR